MDFLGRANTLVLGKLGTTKPGTSSGGVHTPTFTADDGAVLVGMRVMSNVLVDYLREHGE